MSVCKTFIAKPFEIPVDDAKPGMAKFPDETFDIPKTPDMLYQLQVHVYTFNSDTTKILFNSQYLKDPRKWYEGEITGKILIFFQSAMDFGSCWSNCWLLG